MAKLVRERGKGVLKALTILIVALLALADTADSLRYSLSDLHFEYASAQIILSSSSGFYSANSQQPTAALTQHLRKIIIEVAVAFF